jgi:hypothetical protein
VGLFLPSHDHDFNGVPVPELVSQLDDERRPLGSPSLITIDHAVRRTISVRVQGTWRMRADQIPAHLSVGLRGLTASTCAPATRIATGQLTTNLDGNGRPHRPGFSLFGFPAMLDRGVGQFEI